MQRTFGSSTKIVFFDFHDTVGEGDCFYHSCSLSSKIVDSAGNEISEIYTM